MRVPNWSVPEFAPLTGLTIPARWLVRQGVDAILVGALVVLTLLVVVGRLYSVEIWITSSDRPRSERLGDSIAVRMHVIVPSWARVGEGTILELTGADLARTRIRGRVGRVQTPSPHEPRPFGDERVQITAILPGDVLLPPTFTKGRVLGGRRRLDELFIALLR